MKSVDSDLQMTGDIKVADDDEQSVKKIYCHPVKMYSLTANKNSYRLTFIVFNNSPTAFTRATFAAFIQSIGESTLYNASLLASGGFYETLSSTFIVASYLAYLGSSRGFVLAGIKTDGTKEVSEGLTFAELFDTDDKYDFYDGVNAIN